MLFRTAPPCACCDSRNLREWDFCSLIFSAVRSCEPKQDWSIWAKHIHFKALKPSLDPRKGGWEWVFNAWCDDVCMRSNIFDTSNSHPYVSPFYHLSKYLQCPTCDILTLLQPAPAKSVSHIHSRFKPLTGAETRHPQYTTHLFHAPFESPVCWFFNLRTSTNRQINWGR